MLVRNLLGIAFAVLLPLSAQASDPWLYNGRIGGTFIYNSMSDADLNALLDQRARENVSILELDSQLSYYLTDQEFDEEVAFLDRAAQLASARGMRSVIYYPSLEVLTRDAIDDNGVIANSTMARDNPDWVQWGIDGTPNVFYGGQEVWVSPGEESAWMSPNTGYRDYFIERIEKLAATELDGVWLDVPIYLDTATLWPGVEPQAAAAFRDWTVAQGLNGGAGYDAPSGYNMNDAGFRAWIKWRHVNLASFLDDVRQAAQAVDPDFAVIVENFPMDYFDGTSAGLDGTYLPNVDNFITVWETDSVSNTQAMKWSTPDDFENKLAMLKWGRSVYGNQPSWSFSYGFEPLDAALTMAATVATQNVPFESQTPSMLRTVDTDFRRNWFGYVRDHEAQLLQSNREAEIAVWYSSASRDFQDYDVSGKFGIYSVTTPPTPDDTWWAKRPTDSVVTAPHVGGYRGMSAAMIRMNIPHSVVHGRDTGPAADITNLDMLLLPSVGAMSDADAQYIRDYVQGGGVLLATGELPGTRDETGASRAQSALADLFSFPAQPAARVNRFGSGLAIYRPDIVGSRLFGAQLDAGVAADTLSELEKLVRIHVDEPFTLEDGEHFYVDRAVAGDDEHLLYVVNYSGLQLPLIQDVRQVVIHYRVPDGKMITGVVASTPDNNGLNGFANITDPGHGVVKIEAPVDQFALLEIKLADAPVVAAVSYEGPQFDTALQAEAAQSGLNFILDRMRNTAAAAPYRYGVYTNLLDNEDSTEIYTNGHHVTAEHMGLLLRTSACMGNDNAYDEAYQFVSELMYSPLYHLPNWSIDKNSRRPFLFYDDFRNNWFNANAPLDDLRLIHGLIDGSENFLRKDASDLADSMFEGLYWTSVTDRSRNTAAHLFPQYAGGLLGFAWDWSEVDDNSLNPPSTATGTGYLGTDLLPVDYQDLGAIAHAAERDQRWHGVLQSTTQLLLDSEISLSGLYYNGYRADGSWTGDFEYQGDRRGEHLKVIQVLWTAIHLARVSESATDALSDAQKALAQASAARSLGFFKDFYLNNNRVPEYLTFAGSDVEDCINNQPANCLARGSESLFDGEARIYAQIARLATLLGDRDFSNRIINEKIVTDRISDAADPRYGMIGVSTAGSNDAEAWNVLESVFSMCLNAISDDDSQGPVANNNAPVAVTDTFVTNEETAVLLAVTQLLVNDTDADNDTLSIAGLPSRSENGGSVTLLESGDWQYTPALGFTGADTVSYAISDGRGGTAIGQINIDVRLVPKSTHLTTSIDILTGSLNYGSVEFLSADDADTYDIDAAQVDGGYVVDWSSSGIIANHTEVTRLIMTYAGHYSVPDVSQETFLYNFTTAAWESMDTRIVGEQTDSVVRLDITDNPQNYINTDGETRVRVRGSQSTQQPTVWANSLNWLAYRGNPDTGNNPPIANDVSVSTPQNAPVNVTLAASDADGDTITYTLDTTALNGTISGDVPNLTYTPRSGFAGMETFSYLVNDGSEDSEPAVVTITVLQSGIISNLAAGITIDGDLREWSGYLPFAADPADVSGVSNPLDWRQLWMAHDGSDFYIAYRNDGPVDVSWGQTIYMDIDDNQATGAQFGLPIGADRVLQGRFLYRYAGNGNDWNWNFIAEVAGTSNNGDFEYRIPRAALGNSELLKLALVGSNEPYGGTGEDLYPDGVYTASAEKRFLTYTAVAPENSPPNAADFEVVTTQDTPADIVLGATDADNDLLTYNILTPPTHGTLTGTPPALLYTPAAQYTGADRFEYRASDGMANSRIATVSIDVQTTEQSQVPSNPVLPMTIDGNPAEWLTLRYFDNDPDDITGSANPVDYLRAAMAHDAQYFYLTFTNDGQDLSLLQDWLFTVYIDTDLNAATGYQSGLAIGADYMQQGRAVYSYVGAGADWSWLPLSVIPRAASGSDVELAIPRQQIGDPSEIRMVLIGDNQSIGGFSEDVYPDGTYNSNAAIRYLNYRTGGGVSAAAFAPALDGIDDPVSSRDNLTQNAVRLRRQSELEPVALSVGTGAIGLLSLAFLGAAGYRRLRPRLATNH